MQNFVPLGTGNSRLMKSNIPAGTTWEQAIAMLNSGTFPYDTGQLNAAGISVEGTPLNKQTLLQDTTAQQFGFTGDATVDQVLQILKNAAVVNSAGDALETILGSKLLSIPGVQIVTGSYIGTGTYGASNPNTLTFEFEPKIVFVMLNGLVGYGESLGFCAITGLNSYRSGIGSGSPYWVTQYFTWSGNALQWYATASSEMDASCQLNNSGTTYYYTAIGRKE